MSVQTRTENPPPNGILLVLVGPAGAGKTTLAHRIQLRSPDARAFSVSHTTRPIRTGEEDGRDYYFVDRARFEAMVHAGAFAEWAEVHGNLYGTSKAEIRRLHGDGKVALFDIDIVGAHNLWRQYPDQVRLAFLLPPSWSTLVHRLQGRGSETPATVQRRLRTAKAELHAVCESSAPWHVIVNDHLESTTSRLEALLRTPPPPPEDPRHHPAMQAFLRDASSDPLTS